MKRRSGFTIVEVLMVASIGTFLLALVTILMVRTLDSHRTIQGHLRNTLVRNDLATTVRKDVHAADSVEIEGSQFETRIRDRVIIYASTKDGISRIEKRANVVVREESFFISKFHSVELERIEQFDKEFLVFAVRQQARPSSPIQTAIQIVAEIGKHNET